VSICLKEMEKARMERVDNQAKGEAPAAGTANRSYRQIREDDPAVKVPARVKAGVAAADRDGAAARDVVAVVIVQLKVNPNKEKTIMPGLNRSGPRGAGPMTGGRRGLCGCAGGPADLPVYGGGYGYGRGVGFRRGFGRGRGRGVGPAYGGFLYPPTYVTGYPVSRNDEIEMLRADAEAMQKSLEAVQQRIAELEKDGSQ